MCSIAWCCIEPAINEMFSCRVTNKFAGTIVVLDPTDTNRFLFTASIESDYTRNNPDDAKKYARFAAHKAELTARTGMPSRVVQQTAPHLLTNGDIKWGGSVIRDGLIVGFSGVQAVYDEMFAGMMAEVLIAMCRDAMTKPGGIMASDYSHIGG